ncbi:hypothetical protein N8I74_06435 [Chitiniphilus purpureus]|uniref:Serine protease n=1 Tax=Chitiniphilus purpureus TaxID=2981137 RepID=A0ABY6DQZ8_9NEIS|nr:hypothetical protein [Chitiniphilus sp. CD1]UXY16653.1 hypothetical protein N8I74_06435 [Chitiniphilus sp. CD1]
MSALSHNSVLILVTVAGAVQSAPTPVPCDGSPRAEEITFTTQQTTAPRQAALNAARTYLIASTPAALEVVNLYENSPALNKLALPKKLEFAKPFGEFPLPGVQRTSAEAELRAKYPNIQDMIEQSYDPKKQPLRPKTTDPLVNYGPLSLKEEDFEAAAKLRSGGNGNNQMTQPQAAQLSGLEKIIRFKYKSEMKWNDMTLGILKKLGYHSAASDACNDQLLGKIPLLQREAAFSEDWFEVLWRKYLKDPDAFKAEQPQLATNFSNYHTHLNAVLNTCFTPAAPEGAYSAMDAPRRLGFLEFGEEHICEAYLISKEHILTARHCWQGRPSLINAYKAGKVTFRPLGSSDTRQQVCAAKTDKEGLSVNMPMKEELLVMRIAPVDFNPEPVKLASAKELVSWVEKKGEALPTQLTVFTRVSGAEIVSPKFKGSIGTSKPAGCYIVNYNPGTSCFTHYCLTYPGTSGAPVFANFGKDWKLVGVHLGAAIPQTVKAYPSCGPNSTNLENAALLADQNLLNKYLY